MPDESEDEKLWPSYIPRNALAYDLCGKFRNQLIAAAQADDPIFPWLEMAEFAIEWCAVGYDERLVGYRETMRKHYERYPQP